MIEFLLFQTRDQHDVQELNRILFSAIEASLVGTSGQNLIHSLYHGTLVNQVVHLKVPLCIISTNSLKEFFR